MLMMMRSDKNIIKSPYLNFTSLRWTNTFAPTYTHTINNTTTSTNTDNILLSQYNETEIKFINNINTGYQFTKWYTAGQIDIGIKYLQYFLKTKTYYTGTINGINTTTTIAALYTFQLDNHIVNKETDQWAWYLWPTTREVINTLLKKLLQ